MIETENVNLNAGVYLIVNDINGHIYVGSSMNFKNRFRDHKYQLINNKHPNRHLQFAWNKYDGLNNFCFIPIYYLKEEDNLLEKEQYWLDSFMSEKEHIYNICPIAGSNFGRKNSKETLKKISENRKGKMIGDTHPNAKLTNEYIPKIKEMIEQGIPMTHIAKYYNVSNTAIRNIDYGKSWTFLQNDEEIKNQTKKHKNSNRYRGENSPTAKLTDVQVIEIKKLLLEGKYLIKDIAKMFNVKDGAISLIKLGRTWSHVQIPSPLQS